VARRPVRFPRRHARPRPGPEGGGEPQFEIFAKIEDSVRGLMAFCAGTVFILARMTARPHRFDASADARGYLSPRVHPFTLLTLSAFFTTTTLRVLMTLLIVSIASLFRGCQAETQVPLDTDAVTRDLVALPRVDDVILIGIPSVIVVTLLLRATQYLLQWMGADPRRCEAFFNIGLYIVAFQSLWLLVALGLAVSISNWVPDYGGVHSEAVGEGVAVLFTVAWPAVMFRKRLRAALASRPGGSQRRPGQVGTAAMAIGLSCLTPWPEVLVAYPLASRQAKALTADRPVLKVALADLVDGGGGARRLVLLLSNNADETLFLFPEHAQIDMPLADGKGRIVPAIVEDWQRSREKIIAMAPRETRWLSVVVTPAAQPDYIGCDWAAIRPDDARGVPDDVYGRLCLATLSTSGEHTPVYAYVRADRGTLARLGRPAPP
jgi:hypothetical protein